MPAQFLFADVPEDRYFIVSDGSVIKNIYQLRTALEKMNQGTFAYHINPDKNDFANWIRDVIGDEKLARELFSSHSKDTIIRLLEKAIAAEERAMGVKKEVKTITKKAGKKHQPKPAAEAPAVQVVPAAEEKPAEPAVEISQKKIDEILLREKNIENKEEKISELGEHMEKKLAKIQAPGSGRFFDKDFLQGMTVGFFLSFVIFLIYLITIS